MEYEIVFTVARYIQELEQALSLPPKERGETTYEPVE